MKTCPYCAEEVQDSAIRCRYCHSSLGPAGTTSPDALIETPLRPPGASQMRLAPTTVWTEPPHAYVPATARASPAPWILGLLGASAVLAGSLIQNYGFGSGLRYWGGYLVAYAVSVAGALVAAVIGLAAPSARRAAGGMLIAFGIDAIATYASWFVFPYGYQLPGRMRAGLAVAIAGGAVLLIAGIMAVSTGFVDRR